MVHGSQNRGSWASWGPTIIFSEKKSPYLNNLSLDRMEHVNIWSTWSCKSVHKCKHRSHFDCTSPAKDMFYPMTSPPLQWPSVKYASLHPERIKLSVKLESDFQALSCDLTSIVQLALVAVSGDVIKQSPDPYLARLASRWMALLVLASPGVADLYCTANWADICISVFLLC